MKKLLLFFGLAVIASCTHKAIIKPVPVIVINTPAANQHFSNGDEIHITGTVTHTIALTDVAIHITDNADKNEFFHNHYSAGNTTSYSFDARHLLTTGKKTSYVVGIEATDKNGTIASEEIIITIN